MFWNRLRPSLAARLTLWYAVSAFLLTAVATGVMYGVLANNIERQEDRFLGNTVQLLRAAMRDRPDNLDAMRDRFQRRWRDRRQAPRQFVRILDDRGHVLAATPEADAVFERQTLPETPPDAEPGPGVNIEARGTAYRAVAAWASVGPRGGDRRLIQIAHDRAIGNRVLSAYRARLYLILGLAFCCACGVGYAIAKSGLRPIAAMTDAARRVRSSTLDERVPTDRLPAELLSLANTFNQMLQRLEDAFERLSSLSGDLAHELRTPLNNVRGEVEVALGKTRTASQYNETLESVLEECVRLTETIDALLFLARADAAEKVVTRTVVDVGHELDGVREVYEPAAAEAGVRLEIGPIEGAVAAALDRTLFQRAIANLVTNAIRHTPPGGRVMLRTHVVHGNLEVSVADTGTGIPSAHVERVTDRFYRVDPSRSSSSGGLGLGLAIVHSIVRVHGGEMAIESEPGLGTTVTLVFPDTVAPARSVAEAHAAG
jgi:two-component system heavy metal sensor histidine kinase CusS